MKVPFLSCIENRFYLFNLVFTQMHHLLGYLIMKPFSPQAIFSTYPQFKSEKND